MSDNPIQAHKFNFRTQWWRRKNHNRHRKPCTSVRKYSEADMRKKKINVKLQFLNAVPNSMRMNAFSGNRNDKIPVINCAWMCIRITMVADSISFRWLISHWMDISCDDKWWCDVAYVDFSATTPTTLVSNYMCLPFVYFQRHIKFDNVLNL